MIERRSWLLFFLCLHLLFLFVAYVDPSIPFSAVLYIVFLSFLGSLLFFLVRYHRETKFYRSLKDWEDPYDLEWIQRPDSPFEQMIYERFTQQLQQYKADMVTYQVELEQEKDELLSWIHEVKTPLTTMQLMIDRIDHDALKSQLMVEWLRIELLLDQQLHHKRMSSIENDLYIEEVELRLLLYKEIQALRAWCLKKEIGFDLTLHAAVVLSDAKWLGFIMRQVLTNAVKYSEASDIKITSYAQGGRTKLELKDFGRGIDPKDLPRIFEKGFTSTTYHEDVSATGMGLYLVRKAAESLLIEIEVESTLHKGTTFTLTFPQKNELVHLSSM